MTTFYPTTCHEPRVLYKGNADGSRASTNTTTIADTEKTELAGFNGSEILLAIRCKTGNGTPIGVTPKNITVETTGEAPGAVTNFTAAVYTLDCAGLDDGDVKTLSINGAPGTRWRVLNSTGAPIQVEWFVKPNR